MKFYVEEIKTSTGQSLFVVCESDTNRRVSNAFKTQEKAGSWCAWVTGIMNPTTKRKVIV